MHRVVFNLPLAGEWLGGGIRMKWHKQEHSSVSNSFSLSVSLTLSPPFLSSFLALPIASQSLFSHSHSSSVFLLSLQRLDSVPVLQALTQPVVFLNSAVLPRNKRKDSLTSEHCSTSPSFIFYDRCFHLACFFFFFMWSVLSSGLFLALNCEKKRTVCPSVDEAGEIWQHIL